MRVRLSPSPPYFSQTCAGSSVWSEPLPFKERVGGSNPSRRTKFHHVGRWQKWKLHPTFNRRRTVGSYPTRPTKFPFDNFPPSTYNKKLGDLSMRFRISLLLS